MDPVNSPAAAPKSGGGSKSEGNKIGPAGILIIILIVVFSGLIGVLTDQIGNLFQVMKMNTGPILGIIALVLFLRATKK